MSLPLAIPLPVGYVLVEAGALEQLTAAAALCVKLLPSGRPRRPELLRAIEQASAVVGCSEVAGIAGDVVALAQIDEPPPHWLDAACASKVTGKSRSALSARLRSVPPTIRGGKWAGRCYYDPESLREIYAIQAG